MNHSPNHLDYLKINDSKVKMKSDVERCLRGLNFGKLYFHNKEYKTAERYVLDYLKVKPNSSEAYKLLAQISEAIGDHDKALNNYRKSLDIRKQNSETYSFTTPTNQSLNTTVNISNSSSPIINNNRQIFERRDEMASVAVSCANQTLLRNISAQQEKLSETNKLIIEMLNKNNAKIDNIEKRLIEIQDSVNTLNDAQNVLKETLYDYVTHDHEGFDDYVLDDKENDVTDALNNEDLIGNNAWHSSSLQLETSHFNNQKPLSELFKPPSDSWQCDMCLVQNKGSDRACVACESVNPNLPASNEPPKEFKLLSAENFPLQPQPSFANASGFNFGGFNSASVFNNNSFNTFKFGNIAATEPKEPFSFKSSTIIEKNQPNNNNNNNNNISKQNVELNKENGTAVTFQFGTARNFDFKFSGVDQQETYKSPKSPKSPAAEILNDSVDAEDDKANESADNIYFHPVVPLPPKVEVKTGEEEEKILHSCRAKLFRYSNNEWKERGVGDLKILHSPQTDRIRLVMRRDTVLKVCLNHYITPELIVELKEDHKSIQWSALDYSDDPPTAEVFAMRFKNPEITNQFLDAFKSAQLMLKQSDNTNDSQNFKQLAVENDDDIEVIYQKTPADDETLEKAIHLKLPINFFDYENSAPCPGCRGCIEDDVPINVINTTNVTNDMQKNDDTLNDSISTNENEYKSLFSSAIAEYGKVNQTKWDKESNSLFTNTPAPIFSNRSNDLQDGDENADNIYFHPIVPLPPKVEVKTGEEEEKILYSCRAKLFRYSNNDWKERGVGNLKILHSPQTDRIRLVMRRDTVLKVCLNHYITPELTFEMKEDEKSIQWSAIDYSDDPPTAEVFAMRFKNPEITNQFLDAFKSAQLMLKQFDNSNDSQSSQQNIYYN